MIIGLIMLAVMLTIVSAINAVAVYGAAYLANAEYNGYSQSFVIIAKGYAIFFLAIVCMAIFHINSLFIIWIVILAIPCWTIYTLINVSGIKGAGNIILFVCMSYFFNSMLFFLVQWLRG